MPVARTAADASTKSPGRPVLYASVLLGIYLTYLVLNPFFVALTWAVILAILFRGAQQALSQRIGPGHAAVVMTIVVGLAIVLPAVVVISALAREAPQVADFVKQTSRSTPVQVHQIYDAARARIPFPMPADPRDFVAQGAQRAVTFVTPHAGAFVSDFFAMLGTLGATLFALFFMLRDSDKLSRQLCDRLPFTEQENEQLIADTRDLVMASVGAGLAVAAAQGIIGGLSYWLVGIGSPVFWGFVTGLCSLLPVVGATIVWVPAAIGLLLSGQIGRGVVMLLLGVFGISMVDNVLRPLLLSGKTSISGFVVFFGLLGGAAAFGLIGLVLGPIILVITARLFENLRHPDRLDEPTASQFAE